MAGGAGGAGGTRAAAGAQERRGVRRAGAVPAAAGAAPHSIDHSAVTQTLHDCKQHFSLMLALGGDDRLLGLGSHLEDLGQTWERRCCRTRTSSWR